MTTEPVTLHGADLHGGETGTSDHRMSQGTLAMILFLGSEAMLFASFFTAYFMVRYNIAQGSWPPIRDAATGARFVLPKGITAVNTIFLVSSSFTLWWGEHRLKHGDRKSLERGLLVTIFLGLTFLVIQLNEYAHLGFTPQDKAFGSVFYSLTGLHGFHVLVGLILLIICYVRVKRAKDFSPTRATVLVAASLYWHFVDVVWVLLFFLVYLL